MRDRATRNKIRKELGFYLEERTRELVAQDLEFGLRDGRLLASLSNSYDLG